MNGIEEENYNYKVECTILIVNVPVSVQYNSTFH